jgi:integrase
LEVRPASSFPQVFLTTTAPYRPYARGNSIGGPCVSTFLRRVAGAPGAGSHILRHTLARRMRQAGVPLPVMRKILGQTASNSTGHYLRIDLDELREVADNYAELL